MNIEQFRKKYPIQAIKVRVELSEKDMLEKWNEIPTMKSTYEEMMEDIYSALQEAEQTGRQQENASWLIGERCDCCGKPKPANPDWSTCEDCD